MTIEFGTDGWRGVISDDFTFENVRIVAQAIADYVLSVGKGEQGLVIGYDTRFLSSSYAEESARVVAANGIKVYLTDNVTPTPVVSHAVVNLGTAGAIMVTASHNPPHWNGIKFKADFGGSALPSIIKEIEKFLYQHPVKQLGFTEAVQEGLVVKFNPDQAYFDHLTKLVDLKAIAQAGLNVVIDPMYGAGRGYLKRLLAKHGMEVTEIRGEDNPGFGGISPEPIDKNLKALKEAIKQVKAQVGLATDGDGDRVGAIDQNGEFINSHQIYALFLRHLIEKRGWTGGVVKTFSTTQMIDKLAQKYQLKVFETPIGFKYICELFLTEDILLGGEESGGIGFKNHLPERDGILSSLFLLEIMAVYGQTLGEILEGLMADIGVHCYDRVDLHISEEQKKRAMANLKETAPAEMAGCKVCQKETLDGIKFVMDNGSWLLFRASGTEPVVRIYAEGPSKEEVAKLLKFGQEIVS